MDKRVPFSLVLTIPLSDPPENKYNLFRIRLRPAAVPPARQGRHRRARRRAARGEAQRRREPRALGRAGPPAQGREVRDRDDGRGVVEGRSRGVRRAGGRLEERRGGKREGKERERVAFLFSFRSFRRRPTTAC